MLLYGKPTWLMTRKELIAHYEYRIRSINNELLASNIKIGELEDLLYVNVPMVEGDAKADFINSHRPYWANYFAQDRYGRIVYFGVEPYIDYEENDWGIAPYSQKEYLVYNENWKSSLKRLSDLYVG